MLLAITLTVLLIILINIVLIYTNGYQPISFVGDFSEQEKIKIQTDLELVYKEYYQQGLKMEIKKETIQNNCVAVANCTRYYVKYIHNKYGDWVPGTLYVEEGVYKYRPLI